jgi:FkbM family methyltransferase
VRKLSQVVHAYTRRKNLVRSYLLGQEFTVHIDTVPKEPDYDDAWMFACAQHAQVVFDIGANVGYSALIALLSESVKEMVLVEANPEALCIAANNLIRNRLSARCRFVPAFAGEAENLRVRFWTVGTGSAGSIHKSHAKTAAKANSFIDVPTVTLDALCENFNVTPDFIKLDVEGAEHSVLKGSKCCAAKARTRYLVEMHSNPEMTMAQNATDVLDWCQSVGYRAWYLSEATRLDSPAQIQHRGRCHLLLQPSDWPYPDWLIGIKEAAALDASLSPRNGKPI